MSTKPKFPQTQPQTSKTIDQDETQEARKTLYHTILELTQAAGPEKGITAQQVAQAFRPKLPEEKPGDEAWRKIVRQVRAEAVGLARKGHIDIIRRGEVVDPNAPFKGLYKMRQKSE